MWCKLIRSALKWGGSFPYTHAHSQILIYTQNRDTHIPLGPVHGARDRLQWKARSTKSTLHPNDILRGKLCNKFTYSFMQSHVGSLHVPLERPFQHYVGTLHGGFNAPLLLANANVPLKVHNKHETLERMLYNLSHTLKWDKTSKLWHCPALPKCKEINTPKPTIRIVACRNW